MVETDDSSLTKRIINARSIPDLGTKEKTITIGDLSGDFASDTRVVAAAAQNTNINYIPTSQFGIIIDPPPPFSDTQSHVSITSLKEPIPSISSSSAISDPNNITIGKSFIYMHANKIKHRVFSRLST